MNKKQDLTKVRPGLKISPEVLALRQAYPLDMKVELSKNRIRHWYEQYSGQVYVAFSGGKDSTVLLDLVRSLYPEVPAVFVDTGLEYPEIRTFVKTIDNVTWLRPVLTFKQVIEKHGYPVISKVISRAASRVRSAGSSGKSCNKTLYGDERGSYGRLPQRWRFLLNAPFKISDRCCELMKIRPVMKYYQETGRVGYVGTMASDSNSRKKTYLRHGCYLTEADVPRCTPMAFWNQQDVWEYIREKSVPYCAVYDSGVKHTGCVFCCFGLDHEAEPNRFVRMQESHPQLHQYCMEKLKLKDVLTFLGYPWRSSKKT